MLNEQVLLLSKKHGQLKQAIAMMVQVVMSFLDDTPSIEKKLSVIETLRTVTEGKVCRMDQLQSYSANKISRSSSKLNEHESREYSQTSKGNKVISMQLQTSCASSKWRHLGRWDEEKRQNSSSNK